MVIVRNLLIEIYRSITYKICTPQDTCIATLNQTILCLKKKEETTPSRPARFIWLIWAYLAHIWKNQGLIKPYLKLRASKAISLWLALTNNLFWVRFMDLTSFRAYKEGWPDIFNIHVDFLDWQKAPLVRPRPSPLFWITAQYQETTISKWGLHSALW